MNEGFGVNQVIYILAKLLRSDVRLVFVEEPEVHMHPTVLRNFARVLCSLIKNENKRVVLTTHSEHFLSSILMAISEGDFDPEDLSCLLFEKKSNKTSVIQEQKANSSGQIESGLSSFIDGEIGDLKKMLGIRQH